MEITGAPAAHSLDSVTNPDPARHGTCESGASLGCTGYGFARVLPESMIPGSEPESMIQCPPCYDRSAEKYVALTVRLAQL